MKEKQTEIGVVIGRFQLHNLHEAHLELIEHVAERHEKVIIFLGTSSAIGTQRHPMDFITRKYMVEEIFTNLVILPLPDNRDDYFWSNQIHTKVREVFPSGDVTLYGSRDSFIPHYKNEWNCVELEPTTYVSATDIRKKISKRVLQSEDFRAGIIYSVYNQYPIVHSTVDLLIKQGERILLGRKPTQKEFRFVGGFVDPSDENEIQSCKREGLEETGLELDNFKFICSRKVEDWRYRGVKERGIMTHLYECEVIFGCPTPMDDIEELKWFNFEELKKNYEKILVSEHIKLFEDYIKNGI